MAFRFQRRIRIAPGVRLNISKSGVGLSAGPQGASVSLGSRGVYGNAGIPGTGLAYREKLNGSSGKRSGGARSVAAAVGARLSINSDGLVEFKDESDRLLSDRNAALFRKQHGALVRGYLEQVCEDYNALMSGLSKLHQDTPKPTRNPLYEPRLFLTPEPRFGILRRLLGLMFPFVKRGMDRQFELWRRDRQEFEEIEAKRCCREEIEVKHSIEAMEATLSCYLSEIPWPLEPEVDFDVGGDNRTIAIDLLLPDEDHMPDQEWSVPARQYRLISKRISDSKKRQLYRDYIHSIVFRVAGEVFARLPTVEYAMVSAYRQLPDPSDGNVKDEYVVSVIVDRAVWEKKDFSMLGFIDPVEALGSHNIRRKMSKTGVFKRTEPFEMLDLDGCLG